MCSLSVLTKTPLKNWMTNDHPHKVEAGLIHEFGIPRPLLLYAYSGAAPSYQRGYFPTKSDVILELWENQLFTIFARFHFVFYRTLFCILSFFFLLASNIFSAWTWHCVKKYFWRDYVFPILYNFCVLAANHSGEWEGDDALRYWKWSVFQRPPKNCSKTGRLDISNTRFEGDFAS